MISNEIYFLACCAAASDLFYVATQLEEVEPQEITHTRLSVFYAGFDDINRWGYHDVNSNTASVCIKPKSAGDRRWYCSVSKEGEVELYSNFDGIPDIQEKIADAGLRLSKCKVKVNGKSVRAYAGYVTHIRHIGQHLYVCGLNGQVYRRDDRKGWLHLDQGLFNPIVDPLKHESDNNFTCIDGNAEDDIYAVGDSGCIQHFDGKQWSRIKTECDEHLLWVRCYGPDEVWISGYNGTALVGNARDGFKDVSGVDDNDAFWSVCKHLGRVYFATSSTLYVYDANHGGKLAPVVSGLKPELETYSLDQAGGVLWSFGTKDVTWFDGKQWHREQHPDNTKIGA